MRLVILIPCYNEEKRLPLQSFRDYFTSPENPGNFILVNDGSTDQTQSLLDQLKAEFPDRIEVLTLKKNGGKAEAIRQGMLRLLEKNQPFDYAGFMDADLSVPLNSISLVEEVTLKYSNPSMIMGSRIKLFGTTRIKRSTSRHYIGRVIATLISLQLRLPVYDTQCGFKFVRKDMIETLFREPFLSRWLFDVELIWRLLQKFGYEKIDKELIEFPVLNWEEKGASKIPLSYILRVPLDLMRIRSRYAAAKA